MVFHIYSLLPMPCSYLWNQKPFKNLQTPDKGLSGTPCSVPWLYIVHFIPIYIVGPHVMWVGPLLTMAWHIFGLQMVKTASSYGGQMPINCISSCRQPTRSVPPAWRLDVGLTTFHHKKYDCYKNSHWALHLVRFQNNIRQKWIIIWKHLHQQNKQVQPTL
jgi:hypothetical protein